MGSGREGNKERYWSGREGEKKRDREWNGQEGKGKKGWGVEGMSKRKGLGSVSEKGWGRV